MALWQKNLYILWSAGFIFMAGMTSIMPFLPLHIDKNMGMSSAAEVSMWAGLIFGVNFLSAFFVSPLWGKLGDRYGRKIMILRSGFGMALVTIFMGFATNVYQLLLLRFLNGLVAGFNPASVALVATNTPPAKTGYALGLLNSGAVAGSIIGPLYGGILAEYVTYNQIFIITGILILIAALIVLFFVKEEFAPDPSVVNKSVVADFRLVMNIQPLVIVFFIVFIVQFAIMNINPILSLFVLELNPPGGRVAFFAGLIAAAAGITNVFAAPRLGKISDKKGPELVLLFSVLAASILFIPQGFSTNVWQLMFWRFMLGFALGGILPSIYSIIKKYSPAGLESTTYSYSSSASFLGNLLGPILGGLFAGILGFKGIFFVTAFLLFISAYLIYTKLYKRR